MMALLKQIAIPFVSAILGGLVVFLALPTSKPLPKTIRADKIILDGANGIPRVIVSGGGDRGPSVILLNRLAEPCLTLAVPQDGDPSIHLGHDKGGIFMTTDPNGLSLIVVKDKEGRGRAMIRVDAESGAVIETIGLDGKAKP